MTPVTIDAELVAKLTGHKEPVPLVDRDGKLIGYFVGVKEFESYRSWLLAEVLRRVTDERARCALSDPRQYSTSELAEVLRGMGG